MKSANHEELYLSAPHPVSVGRCRLKLHRGAGVRAEGCVVMRVTEGRASLSVNALQVDIEKGMLLYLGFDMTVIAVTDGELEVEFVSMDQDVTGDLFFNITSSSFWNFLYTSPAFNPGSELDEYVERWYLQAAWVEERQDSQTRETVLRESVMSLFVILRSEIEGRYPAAAIPKTRAWAIANDFITLLHRHYARHHDVAYYADLLNITPDYLNVICKENLGYSAKTRIDSQIVIAIKTLLDTTDLSVKIISERLHYDNPSYMCRVFRRMTGRTPTEYRNRHQPASAADQYP